MGYPRFQRARSFKFARRTAGDVAVGTSFAAFDTALDLTLEAQIGDVIEVSVGLLWANDTSWGAADVATWVSGAAVTYFSTGTGTGSSNGFGGWYALGSSTINPVSSGYAMLTLASGDISSGLVTLRLLTKASVAKNVLASTSNPAFFSAKNLGPVDPN